MNNEGFSAYPYESEILLKEGCPIFVLDVDKIKVNNKYKDFKNYDGKTITVIYILHPEAWFIKDLEWIWASIKKNLNKIKY